MSDPVAWVRPLIEARKTTAEAAAYRGVADWHARKHPADTAIVRDGAGETVVYDEGEPTEEQAAHIALNDPRQIIADCEKDLAILAEHRSRPMPFSSTLLECEVCVTWVTGDRGGSVGEPEQYPCRTIRILGWGYRHRDPDGYATVAGDWQP